MEATSGFFPSAEEVEEFWSQVFRKANLKDRLPVLITGSNSFGFALEEGRYLKPLVEATARRLVAETFFCESVLLVGSSAESSESDPAVFAWDNVMQQTVFDQIANFPWTDPFSSPLPMVMLRFQQGEAPHNPKDFISVSPGNKESPMMVTIRLPHDKDRHLMSQGWKAAVAPAALSFGGDPSVVQLISRQGVEGALANELKQLALPVPAAGGFGAEIAVGRGPPSWPEHFCPEALSEAQWNELKSVAEGDVEGEALEDYAAKVVAALQAIASFGLRLPRPLVAQAATAARSEEASPPEPEPGGSFPQSLGPFDLVPTSFRPTDFRLPKVIAPAKPKPNKSRPAPSSIEQTSGRPSCWFLSPITLTKSQRQGVRIKAARLSGQLSPQQAVTLSKADREAANIPEEAAYFSWSYPIEQAMPACRDFTAEYAFLAFGGFMYFDKAQNVICTLALTPGSGTGGLRFADPLPFPPEMSLKVSIDRFKVVTIDALRETGVRFFCWLKPGEIAGAEHGAFAYLFHRKVALDRVSEDLLARDVFFPVLGASTEASKRASLKTPGARVSAVPTNSTAARPVSPAARVSAVPTNSTRSNSSGPAARSSKFTPSDRRTYPPLAPWDSHVGISVALGVDPFVEGEGHVLISVEPPTGAASSCTSLCCVIDVSGSMGAEAIIQGVGGTNETNGLSLLDIAKHGIRTLIHTLGDQDRLSVVAFSSTARCVVAPTKMDADGKKRAEQLLERLEAKGGTNIWAGLAHGLEQLSLFQDEGCVSHIMLLTDGASRDRDLIAPAFREWCRMRPRSVPCTINTFGFGYNLDSALLVELANMGHGQYCFIPDAGFVGTVFVNTVSNLLVTMGANASLELHPGPSAEVLGTYGGFELQNLDRDPRGKRIHLGNLQFGQTRNIVVRMRFTGAASSQPYLCVNGQFQLGKQKGFDWSMESSLPHEKAPFLPDPQAIDSVEQSLCRLCFVDALDTAIAQARNGNREAAAQTISKVLAEIQASPAASSEFVAALLEDVGGQTTEALSRDDWYNKWGRHYLPSLSFAHHLQQCNNFKDPGVQAYGGELFQTIRDNADDVFNDLPAPKPSARPSQISSQSSRPAARQNTTVTPAAPRPAPVISMAAYNNCYGG